jgi:hypothetical protein
MEQFNKETKATDISGKTSMNGKNSDYLNSLSGQLSSKKLSVAQSTVPQSTDAIDPSHSSDNKESKSDRLFGIMAVDQALELVKKNVMAASRFVRARPGLVIGSALAVGAAAALIIAFNRRRRNSTEPTESAY